MLNAKTWREIYDSISLSGSYDEQIAEADKLIAEIQDFRDSRKRMKALSEELNLEPCGVC